MIPYENWNPITQILVFFDRGPDKGVERLNVSRTDTQGLFKNAWDAAAFDAKKGESQWEALGRIVRERDPKTDRPQRGRGPVGGRRADLGPQEEDRRGRRPEVRRPGSQSAEPLATLWARDAPRGRGRDHGAGGGHLPRDHRRHVLDQGRSRSARRRPTTSAGTTGSASPTSASRCPSAPSSRIRGRRPKDRREVRQGRQDHPPGRPPPLRRRASSTCAGTATTRRWPTSCRPGETDAPETFSKLMAEANRLQDVYCGGVQDRADRQRAARPDPREGPRGGHPGPARLLATRSGSSSTSPGRSSACPGSRSTTPAAATSSSSP